MDGSGTGPGRGNNLWLLARSWAFPVVVAGTLIANLGSEGAKHAWDRALGPAALALMFGLVVVTYARRRAIGGLTRALREPSPDAVVAELRRPLKHPATVPGVQLLVTTSSSIYYAFYGQFGRARDELDAQRWAGAADLYQAGRLSVSALIHYLSGDDFAAGLADARRAEALAHVPSFAPGAQRSRSAVQMKVDVGRVLSEGAATELCDSIAARARAQPSKHITDRLIALWGAAVALERAGRDREAEPFFTELRALAPHCSALHRSPLNAGSATATSEPAPLESSASDAHGACALHPDAAASAHCVRCGNYACDGCAHPISESASICGACYERNLHLRNEHSNDEARLRAAGVIIQGVAVLLFSIVALKFLWRREFAWLAQLAYMALMCPWIWLAGRAVRRLRRGTRFSVGALAIVTIFSLAGILLGVYLFWSLFNQGGRFVTSPEYLEVLDSTREVSPRIGRQVALEVGLIALSFVLVLAIGVSYVPLAGSP